MISGSADMDVLKKSIATHHQKENLPHYWRQWIHQLQHHGLTWWPEVIEWRRILRYGEPVLLLRILVIDCWRLHWWIQRMQWQPRIIVRFAMVVEHSLGCRLVSTIEWNFLTQIQQRLLRLAIRRLDFKNVSSWWWSGLPRIIPHLLPNQWYSLGSFYSLAATEATPNSIDRQKLVTLKQVRIDMRILIGFLSIQRDIRIPNQQDHRCCDRKHFFLYLTFRQTSNTYFVRPMPNRLVKKSALLHPSLQLQWCLTTHINIPSQVINAVQLNPRIDMNPKFRCSSS